jgi:hypothetical protein
MLDGGRFVAECSFCGEAFDEAEASGLAFVIVPTREIGGVGGVTKVQLHSHVECLASRVRHQDADLVRRLEASE